MFKETLKEYIVIKGISQLDLSKMVGDSQQAVSDFLNTGGNPRRKTRAKFNIPIKKVIYLDGFTLLHFSCALL